MIRLVHQFDEPRARASVAAPKSSGCCCCCCCCIATLIGSSILTARATGRGFKPRTVGSAEVEPAGPTDSMFRPTVDVPVPNLRTVPSKGWKVLGFFLLPICLTLTVLLGALVRDGGVAGVAGLGAYVGGLLFLRKRAGLRGWVFAVLLVGIPILTVIEAFVWIYAVFK